MTPHTLANCTIANCTIGEHRLAYLRQGAGRRGLLHFAAGLDNRHLLEIREELDRLQLPVLIIRGEAAPYLSPAISRQLAEQLPQADLISSRSAGHSIREDEPELLASAMLDFFQTRS
ncbi:alpha/beta fold hydrolase [Desulfogranum mediterraneum]|uniref:alpha/beta fold hydrolase n=1 Tax=Desulfogranum mediterraneum TaxID=160661 RepID=UPI000424A574|nr:alpha/beta hydrolase [Desulfogranum mediterraneum]